MISFDFGQSLFHQGEFQRAAKVLEAFCATADKKSPEYREAIFKRLRIYTELEQSIKRTELENEIHESLGRLDSQGLSTYYYVQGYNAHYEGNYSTAYQLFEKALHNAMECSC